MKSAGKTKTPEQKVKATAKNKIRRIERELRRHPKTSNNPKMMERLQYWKGK